LRWGGVRRGHIRHAMAHAIEAPCPDGAGHSMANLGYDGAIGHTPNPCSGRVPSHRRCRCSRHPQGDRGRSNDPDGGTPGGASWAECVTRVHAADAGPRDRGTRIQTICVVQGLLHPVGTTERRASVTEVSERNFIPFGSARKVLGRSKICELAHAFLRGYSYNGLKLAQLLGRLSASLTSRASACCSASARPRRPRRAPWSCGRCGRRECRGRTCPSHPCRRLWRCPWISARFAARAAAVL
jgi:hypothetical protein